MAGCICSFVFTFVTPKLEPPRLGLIKQGRPIFSTTSSSEIDCPWRSNNEFFDYDAKYNGQVDEITPARISDELTKRVQMLTSAIYDILGCSGIIRVDYIVTAGEKLNLLEVNTTPGMTTTSFIPQQVRAAGLDIKDVMTDIIENKF